MNDPTPLPWAGGAYSVKRHGITLTNCDQEPVQTPGCVQAHGALLVLRPSDLTVLQVTENAERVLGAPVEDLLGRPIRVLLGRDREAQLRRFLAGQSLERNPLYVFAHSVNDTRLDVTVHTVDGVVVVEFEPNEGPDDVDCYLLVKQGVARLRAGTSLADFCRRLTEEVRTLTGHERVMVYRFHEDGHGEIVAESRAGHLPSWLGLHYPADDIPKPAREVFQQVWIRPLRDAGGELAELVPLVNPETGRPLVMTHCALRGASVMYTEYLRNMGVVATLTMPIREGDSLWGLVACHHQSGPKWVSYQMRAACELLAQVVSLQRAEVSAREHLAYRLRIEAVHNQLVGRAAREGELATMTIGAPTLCDGLSSGGAAVLENGRWHTVGITPDLPDLEQLGQFLNTRPEFTNPIRTVYVTDMLMRDHPPAATYADRASGLVAFPVSRTRRTLVIWFRPETIQTVTWGGNPADKPLVPGPHGPRLTPRASFELFAESVRGRSLPWLLVEVDAAIRLRAVLLEVVVTHAEHLTELNADLARTVEELDAFAYVASHDLKEPLRGIYTYAHQLVEEVTALDSQHQRTLGSLLRLTVRMDSLLDSLLHLSRVGRNTLSLGWHDLNEIVAEAIEMVSSRTTDARSEVVVPRPLPRAWCDRVRCREIFTNLLSNGLKYNDRDQKRVEVGYLSPDEESPVRAAFPAGTERQVVYTVRDNGIGIDPMFFGQVFRMFKRLHGRDAYSGGSGVGLTITKRLVERHQGQIWLDSTPGVGTTFYFTLSREDGR